MKIVIKTKNLELNQTLKNFIEEKINSLEKFLKIFYSENYFYQHQNIGRDKGKPKVESWIEVGKESLHHQKGPFFWAECQIRFPKKSLIAKARAKDIKTAITEVKYKLKRELKHYKERLTSLTKRRARVLKKEMHLSSLASFRQKGRIREEGI